MSSPAPLLFAEPTLAELRVAFTVMRALDERTEDDARGSAYMLVALDLAARIRDREDALVARERQRQWALQTRADLERRRG